MGGVGGGVGLSSSFLEQENKIATAKAATVIYLNRFIFF